jgi:outer membrane immunogenic protein
MRFLTTVLRASAGSLAWILASAMLTPGVAADLSIAPIYKAPPQPLTNWGGTYVGVSGGGAWGSAVVRNQFTGADQTPRFDVGGGIVGATAGTNVQSGNLVLGFEGDISAATKKGTSFEFPPAGAFSNEVRERWLSTFRGRIGYTRDNWLFYVTGGGAGANIEHSVTGPLGAISETHWHWGWTAGGGVEVKITQDWSAKVEYLYVGLQDKSYFNPAPSAAFPSNQSVRLDDHIVRVGVNYKLPWTVLDSFFKR